MDALERVREIKEDHRIGLGRDVEDAARELAAAINAMRKQTDWIDFYTSDVARREILAETVNPYIANRKRDIDTAWVKLQDAWCIYQKGADDVSTGDGEHSVVLEAIAAHNSGESE